MTDKTVLITGGSRGLGQALVHKFLQEGYIVHSVSRNTWSSLHGRMDSTVQKQKIHLHTCDLGDVKQVNALCARIQEEQWVVDVLINNAAIHGPIGPFVENQIHAWRNTIETDLMAPVALCQAVLPIMRRRRSGVIINLSGGGATSSRPNFSAYATAKAALVRFSEILAEEEMENGIRVNCVAPGAMNTQLLHEVLAQGVQGSGMKEHSMAASIIANRTKSEETMERAVALVTFLSGSAGSTITGKIISAQWDNWEQWPAHTQELGASDIYTLRRIVGRDRNIAWGDR